MKSTDPSVFVAVQLTLVNSFDVSDYTSACPDMVNITCESSSGGMFVATLNRNTINIKKLDLPSNELTNVSCTATNTEGSVDFMTQVLNSDGALISSARLLLMVFLLIVTWLTA